jgi:hypothetical protein
VKRAAKRQARQCAALSASFVMPIAYAAVSAAQWSRQAARRRGSCPLAYSGLYRHFAALGISRNRYVLRQKGGGGFCPLIVRGRKTTAASICEKMLKGEGLPFKSPQEGDSKILGVLIAEQLTGENDMKYFEKCKSIEEAKKIYRELLKQYHPDHAGKEGEAVTVEVINEFNLFLDNFVSNSFDEYFADKKEKPDYSAITPFQEILKKIIHLDCGIEIIGYWIYCFKSYSVYEYLKELGFWFSGKHKAWIYSGGRKSRYVTKATLDQLRISKGNYKVEKYETEQLTAV